MVKKIKFYNNFKVKKIHKNSILLIGNFDGLHLGHQKLFNLAKKYKKKFKLKIGVITFEPMPKMYFNKKLKNFRISSEFQKKNKLEKIGIDFLITKKFNKRFSKIKSTPAFFTYSCYFILKFDVIITILTLKLIL